MGHDVTLPDAACDGCGEFWPSYLLESAREGDTVFAYCPACIVSERQALVDDENRDERERIAWEQHYGSD